MSSWLCLATPIETVRSLRMYDVDWRMSSIHAAPQTVDFDLCHDADTKGLGSLLMAEQLHKVALCRRVVRPVKQNRFHLFKLAPKFLSHLQ